MIAIHDEPTAPKTAETELLETNPEIEEPDSEMFETFEEKPIVL